MIDVQAEPMQSLRERTSEKWRAYPPDVLPLFVAEMDYPLAEPIAEALTAAVRRSDTGYVSPSGGLPEAFAGFAERRWGWQVDPAQVTTTADVAVVIVEALRLAIRPGDGVVINPPVYPPFFDVVPEAGGRVVEVPMLRNAALAGGWSLDLDGLERAFAAGARAYLLCNPHNPLGHPHPADQLAAVAELAAHYDVAVVSDEIHAALTLTDGVFTPFLSVSDAARQHGIAAESASKAWNLAGLKCAMFVTAGERMSRLIASLPEGVQYRTGLFGQLASTVAFAEGEEWLDGAIRSLERNRDALTTLLAEKLPGVGYAAPRASYLAWLDFHALGWGDDPSIRALEGGRVALSSGPRFGEQGAGFARLNFACSPEVLSEAIDRLAGA